MYFDRKTFQRFQSFLPVQIFLCYCFIISGLLVNFAQLLTWILIWPFSKPIYRRVNYFLGTLLWSQLTFLYSWWSDSNIRVFCDDKDLQYLRREYSICLVNHRYEIDWLIGLVVSQKLGLLGGLKIIGKRSISLVPILGWSWLFAESIFLRRVWENDKTVLEKDIQQLVTNYPDDYYFAFLMACEGTRFTESKRIESMKYGRTKGLPELKYHLLPRTKGLMMVLQGAKDKIPAVYNFTLAFPSDSASPKFRTLLKGRTCQAQVHIKRIPTSTIPYNDENKFADWMHKLFQEKDRTYDYFTQNNTLEGLDLPELKLERNWKDLCVELFWCIVIGIPSIIWFIKFSFTSTLLAKLIFLTIVSIVYIILQLMINMSVIKTDKKTN